MDAFRGSHRRPARAAVGLALAVLVALVLASSAGAAPTTKKYVATVAPASVAAGTPVTFTVRLTNHASSNTVLGSANITLPTGLSSVSVGAVTTSPAGKNWFALPYDGSGIVKVRSGGSSDRLSANQWVSVAVTATTPCAGPLSWSTAAKQSNDFLGTGNDFALVPSGSVLSTSVAAGPLARFSVSPQQPGTRTAGASFGISLRAEDGCGNLVSYGGTATLSGLGTAPDGTPPSYGMGGATVTFSGGTASRTVTPFKAETGARIAATSGAVTGQTGTFDVVAGPLHHFVFGSIGGQTAGTAFTAGVTAEDQWRNVQTAYAGPATFSGLAASPNGTAPSYGGTGTNGATVSFAAGIASTAVTPKDADGTAQLTVADGAVSSSSTAFAVVPASPAALTFDPALGGIQPSTARVNTAITPAVAAAIVDAFGNVTPSTASVAVAVGTNPTGATLSGTSPMAASAGVATFADLSIDKLGTGYTLTASSAGLSGATSAPFDVVPGPPVKLTVDTLSDVTFGTSFVVTVRSRDADGNVSPVSAATPVSVSLASCGSPPGTCSGTLSGTTTSTIAAGQSSTTFVVQYSTDQNFVVLRADDGPGGLQPGTSNAFNVLQFAQTKTLATGQSETLATTTCPAGDATPQNPICVVVTFPQGGSGSPTLLLADCADGTGEPCTEAIVGVTGTFEAQGVWKLVWQGDKSVFGRQGVVKISFLIADTFGAASVPVRECARRGVPNPGEKMCIDYQHRQNDGDSEVGFTGQGDPFLKGK